MAAQSAGAPIPLLRSIVVTAVAAGVLLLLPIGLREAGFIDQTVAKPLVLGLFAAALSHVLGAVIGARVASLAAPASGAEQSLLLASLAATTVRLLATPSLALSLYFLLPQKAAPLLLGAVAAHVLLMVVDIVTMQSSSRRSAGPSAPQA